MELMAAQPLAAPHQQPIAVGRGLAVAEAEAASGGRKGQHSRHGVGAPLGIQQALAQQVRQAFFGEEAQRVLRDRDDIRVMVRLPREDRESLHTFEVLNVRTPDGTEVPLVTVADVAFVKAPADLERSAFGARPMSSMAGRMAATAAMAAISCLKR